MPYLSPWLIVLAGIVYGGLQLLKSQCPVICGRHAVCVNLLFTTAGVIAFLRPEQILTVGAAQSIVTAALLAAGLHGTVSRLRQQQGSSCDADSPAASSVTAPCIALLGLVLILPGLTGCKTVTAKTPAKLPALAVDQTDATANEVLQAAHGFAASVTADAQAGKLPVSATQKAALLNLNRTLNIADKAEIAYHACGGGASCSASALIAAISQVEASFGAATVSLTETAAAK